MYTIKQASIRTGVSIPLLRAWERRYGIPTPDRTASGYRLYGDESLAQLRAMRRLVDDGWAPSQAAAEVLAGRVPMPAEQSSSPASASRDQVGDGQPSVIDRIVTAARDLDQAALESALGEPTLTSDFETVVSRVWLPAMVAVGDAWASGTLDVASEHAVAAALLRRLGTAYEAAGRSQRRPDVLVGLPPHGRHELGALAFAVYGRRAGLSVLYLGPDVPAESWALAVEETGARVAVIGVVTEEDRSAADRVIEADRKSVV